MPRYIRYLENGSYKYASVKPVGDIDLLKMDAPDLVTAINMLIDGGIAESVRGEFDKISGSIKDNSTAIDTQKDLLKVIISDQADFRAGLDDAIANLSSKVDLSEYQKRYDQITKTLLEKINIEDYREEYARLVEEITKKANDIDIQAVVESFNQEIVNQTIEVDNAKTGILELDEKVDAVKSEITTTIAGVDAEVEALDKRVESQKTDILGQISEAKKSAEDSVSATQADLDSTKKHLATTESSLTEAKEKIDATKEELDSVKNNIVYKVEIFSTNGNVFKNGAFGTTLEARVYKGVKDVTDEFNAAKFRWTRTSLDRESDELWNMNNSGGSKSVVITPDDLRGRATFNCEVLE